MDSTYVYISILLCALFTFLTRILAFIVFSRSKPNPSMDYLKRHLPVMIMTILIFYSLSGTDWDSTKGFPELLTIGIAVILHIKSKNALISILSSTVFYMLILQTFFA